MLYCLNNKKYCLNNTTKQALDCVCLIVCVCIYIYINFLNLFIGTWLVHMLHTVFIKLFWSISASKYACPSYHSAFNYHKGYNQLKFLPVAMRVSVFLNCKSKEQASWIYRNLFHWQLGKFLIFALWWQLTDHIEASIVF